MRSARHPIPVEASRAWERRWDQHLNMLVGDDVIHLLLIPITRVGNRDSGSLCHTNRVELLFVASTIGCR